MTETVQTTEQERKPKPLIELLVSIIIPSLILMKFSGEDKLGPTMGLIVALLFPIGLGLYELIQFRKFNWVAILGVISVILTGGIGLLKLDAQWLAVKEAAVPTVIGLGVLISTFTPYPLIRTLLFKSKAFKTELIQARLSERQTTQAFEERILKANYLFAGTFVFSAVMNYALAKWIVNAPAGTTEFNEQLGQMTLVSYPVIAIPSMIMMLAIFYYLWKTIKQLTGLTLEEVMVGLEKAEKAEKAD